MSAEKTAIHDGSALGVALSGGGHRAAAFAYVRFFTSSILGRIETLRRSLRSPVDHY
jgi:hypothetical protein